MLFGGALGDLEAVFREDGVGGVCGATDLATVDTVAQDLSRSLDNDTAWRHAPYTGLRLSRRLVADIAADASSDWHDDVLVRGDGCGRVGVSLRIYFQWFGRLMMVGGRLYFQLRTGFIPPSTLPRDADRRDAKDGGKSPSIAHRPRPTPPLPMGWSTYPRRASAYGIYTAEGDPTMVTGLSRYLRGSLGIIPNRPAFHHPNRKGYMIHAEFAHANCSSLAHE